nr:hypothetical protein [Catenibacterium mitsuokai]
MEEISVLNGYFIFIILSLIVIVMVDCLTCYNIFRIAESKNDNKIEDTIDNIFNSIELEDDEQVELTKLNTLKDKLDDASIVLNKIEEIKREISETEEMISSHKASIKDFNSELNNIRREAKEVTISLHKIFHDTKK